METSAAVVVPGRRLGKLPPRYDPRTLRLARYIEKRKLPKIPKTHTLSKKTLAAFPSLGMFRNDQLGDCTCASIGHAFQTWRAFGSSAPAAPTDADVVALYDKVNGGKDEGANMLDVLNKLRSDGLGGDKIRAFVAITPTNHDQVRTAHLLFGGIYFGANLPVTAQAQENGLWDPVEGNGSEPGSWGGHAMNIVDTKQSELVAVTWGHLQRISWSWWDRYVDEAYAILEEDWIGDDRRSPQGFSLGKLEADIKGL